MILPRYAVHPTLLFVHLSTSTLIIYFHLVLPVTFLFNSYVLIIGFLTVDDLAECVFS